MYIAKTPQDRAHDLTSQFDSTVSKQFVEVQIRSDLLSIRQNYIHQLAACKDGNIPILSCIFNFHLILTSLEILVAENLDPEFQLALRTNVDLCFITIPPEILAEIPASADLTITDEPGTNKY